jgi:hypothetical protein
MQSSSRMYSCCRCQAQVIICSRCDRGHRYCAGQCATDARSDSLKRASDKYRSTRAGRINNAVRQKRYRQRQKQIVTHQGSLLVTSHDVLKAKSYWPEKVEKYDHNDSLLICHHCGAVCDPFLRQDFLHQSRFLRSFRRQSPFWRGNGNR